MRIAAKHHRVLVIERAGTITADAPLAASTTVEAGIKVYRPAERAPDRARPPMRTSLRAILGAVDTSHLAVWVDHPRVCSLVPKRESPVIIWDLRDPGTADAGTVACADLLLADGVAGYEASRRLHPRAYLFPHAVDVEHFARAKSPHRTPIDQSLIPAPRVGFWGTIDDRIDFGLLEALASRLPTVHFVIIGAVESGHERLGSMRNLHWLGPRAYADLPDYAGGWNAAFLPFALNEGTRFLSPPQIPEFLAAGRPIVSTPLRDVQHPYGASGLVKVADSIDGFVAALQESFRGHGVEWLTLVDRYLRALSWESTWEGIEHLVNGTLRRRIPVQPPAWSGERMATLTPAAVMH
jgi:glycosyltransferase involved in cell wall biosynthesis